VNDLQYIQHLVSQGEHQQQDFKYKVQDAAKLARSVSAFANTEGGRLLIGVRDDGHLSGVRSDEEIFMMHQAAMKYCRPQPAIRFDTYHVGGRTIVVCTVPPCEHRPVFAIDDEGKKRAYIRIADENIVASPVHIALWRQESSANGTLIHYGDDEQRLMSTLAGKQLPLNPLVRRCRLPRHRVVTTLARFVRYGLVKCRYVDQQFLFSLTN
jgi:hypothetical protein